MDVLGEVSILEIIGVTGFILYVVNYCLLTIGRLNAEQPGYFVLNWLAASFVLIGLTHSFNLASALIQIFWIMISTWGIYIRFFKPPENTTDRMIKRLL